MSRGIIFSIRGKNSSFAGNRSSPMSSKCLPTRKRIASCGVKYVFIWRPRDYNQDTLIQLESGVCSGETKEVIEFLKREEGIYVKFCTKCERCW